MRASNAQVRYLHNTKVKVPILLYNWNEWKKEGVKERPKKDTEWSNEKNEGEMKKKKTKKKREPERKNEHEEQKEEGMVKRS